MSIRDQDNLFFFASELTMYDKKTVCCKAKESCNLPCNMSLLNREEVQTVIALLS